MIADQAERDRALEPSRSFIVQAPAGSGKTTLLVGRYLKLLSLAKNPEEVLAITFTRKAAAEMRKRVIEKLDNPGEIAHRLRIMTIDAFCASLTRQVPVLARFGAQPEIVEDAHAFYKDAAFASLADLENPSVVRLLSHFDNNVEVAAGLLAAMLAKRDQWLRNAGNPPTRRELEAALLFERNRFLEKAKKLQPGASEEFARDVLTQKHTWKVRSKTAQVLAGRRDAEAVRAALIPLLTLPPPAYDDAQWEALEGILALLLPAVKQLFLEFSGQNSVDFAQIAQAAVHALGAADDPTELLLSLDAKISHILVDEFQDTSQSQWELLNLLMSGWQAGDGRTAFLVGDPMQSIYRFREAEVGLFLRARREGIGGAVGGVALEPLTLTTNFRSQEKIIAWVNEVFSRVLPAAEDEASGAVPYSPSTPHHPALAGEAVTWHGSFDRELETQKILSLVKDAKGKVAILVRNRTHLDGIVPALRKAGIRYRAVEIETLGEKQIVQDLYALTRALLHPADRVAWLAILRVPWIGFSLEEFTRHFEGKSSQTIWELVQNVPRLERFRSVIGPSLENRLRGTLRDRVEGAWLALGGPACVEDATDLEDAGIYLDELEKLEQAGGLPELALLEDKLEKLWALPDVDAGPDAVEIMTIHKAKGLEFDTVIVPGLDRAPRTGDRQLLLWKQAGARLLLAPINQTGSGKDPIYEFVRDLDKEAEDIEAGRLFYVAATRAISRLHLLGVARPNEAGEAKPPQKRSLLAKAWFAAAAHFPIEPAVEVSISDSSIQKAPETNFLRRLPASFQLPPPPAPAQWAAPPEGREEDRIEFSWAGETARHVGTVVHRWLQRIAQDQLKGWDAKRVESLRAHFERDLYHRGVEKAGPAAELVAAALKNTLADERGRWVLGPHPEARSEYRIRTPQRSYIVDRMIRESDGTRWVIDFKTSRHEGGEVEAFLDEQRKRYAAQLQAYSAALEDARPGLYFPLHQGWRE